MSRKTLPLLSLLVGFTACTFAACTPATEDVDLDESVLLEEDEDMDEVQSEQDGANVRAATFERPDDPAFRRQVEAVRGASCSHERRAEAPVDVAPVVVARGVSEPGFRVEEDQRGASLDLQVETFDDARLDVEPASAELLEAQARYLDDARSLEASFVGSDRELVEAKAELKERVLGEG